MGYTVNLMRSPDGLAGTQGSRQRLGSGLRRSQEDPARALWEEEVRWPAPIVVRQAPARAGHIGAGASDERGDGSEIQEQLATDPSLLHSKDDRGSTFLHQLALARSAATVKVLLEAVPIPTRQPTTA